MLPWVYRQPDPLIYSQQYLQSLGLAVTWHNPDIHLERPSAPGVEVDSNKLDPDTEYVVVAHVWNSSTTAAAVDMPVKLSYLSFGIGTTNRCNDAYSRYVGERRFRVSRLCAYSALRSRVSPRGGRQPTFGARFEETFRAYAF